MILVDTSVWVDHLRRGDGELAGLLNGGEVLGHPWVTGELAMGRMTGRAEVLWMLSQLPQAVVATPAEVLALVESRELMGLGCGFVDAQLIASTMLTPDAALWTRDRRLAEVAAGLGCSR